MWCLVLQPLKAYSSSNPVGDYQAQGKLSGKIYATGSDTLANMMSFWAEEFSRRYPEVEFELHAEGSNTAPPALLNGSSNLAPMSRQMNAAELALFQQKYGYQPTAIKVAVDAIAVFVHRNNPLKSISIKQLDQIFSAQMQCGGTKKLTHWGELGLDEKWQHQAIEILGRDSRSGSYSFFKDIALCRGMFASNMQTLPGSASIVQAISNNPAAIGFSGMGYKTSGVRTLAIMHQGEALLPSVAADTNWDYPLSRFLYLYVNKAPGIALPELLREFVLFVLSNSGQQTVELDGYAAVSPQVIADDLHKLEIKLQGEPATQLIIKE